MLVRQVPKQIVGESGGEARVNVDFREEEQEECVSLSQCKNCEQVEDEKVMLREERETGIKKKWAKEEGPTNSKHISKGMVLLNKHHSNAAASNWAWKRQIGWQETSQRACNSFNKRQDSETAVRKEAWRLLSNGVVSVLRKICHIRWGKAPGAVEREKEKFKTWSRSRSMINDRKEGEFEQLVKEKEEHPKSKQRNGDRIQNQQIRVAIIDEKNQENSGQKLREGIRQRQNWPQMDEKQKGCFANGRHGRTRRGAGKVGRSLGKNLHVRWRRKQPITERTRTNERSHSGGRHKLEQGKGMGTGRGLWKKRKWTSGSLEVRGLPKKKRKTACRNTWDVQMLSGRSWGTMERSCMQNADRSSESLGNNRKGNESFHGKRRRREGGRESSETKKRNI